MLLPAILKEHKPRMKVGGVGAPGAGAGCRGTPASAGAGGGGLALPGRQGRLPCAWGAGAPLLALARPQPPGGSPLHAPVPASRQPRPLSSPSLAQASIPAGRALPAHAPPTLSPTHLVPLALLRPPRRSASSCTRPSPPPRSTAPCPSERSCCGRVRRHARCRGCPLPAAVPAGCRGPRPNVSRRPCAAPWHPPRYASATACTPRLRCRQPTELARPCLACRARSQAHPCSRPPQPAPLPAVLEAGLVGSQACDHAPPSPRQPSHAPPTSPVCAVLKADLIGFHTYDYARHFVSACTRILGLEGTPAGAHGRRGRGGWRGVGRGARGVACVRGGGAGAGAEEPSAAGAAAGSAAPAPTARAPSDNPRPPAQAWRTTAA